MTTDWSALRARFPITTRCIYLNTGWSGPSSRDAIQAMQQRAEREAFDGPTTPEVRHEKALLVTRTREAFASMLNADVDEVALVYTTTEGVNTVVRGLNLRAGDEILTCNLEHNAIMVPAYMARDRDLLELRIVRFASTEDAAQLVTGFEAAITPRTRLVVLSQISWNRGTLLPMREICEVAHRNGALVAIDAAQSLGQIAIDVREMGCDFLAAPGHKWLLGPDGAAMLYVRGDLIERLQPLAVVHGANRQYDYEGHFEHAGDTIHKFELTTHSGPVLAGLLSSIEMLEGIGIHNIAARCRALADRFVEGLERIEGVRITTPLDDSVRTGIVTFTVRDLNPSETTAALYALDRVVVRVCNDKRLRACFHAFNNESDVDRTLETVAQIAARGIPPGTPSEAEYKAQLMEAFD